MTSNNRNNNHKHIGRSKGNPLLIIKRDTKAAIEALSGIRPIESAMPRKTDYSSPEKWAEMLRECDRKRGDSSIKADILKKLGGR